MVYKFNMAAILQQCGDVAKRSDYLAILWSADRLFISRTKMEDKYIAKAILYTVMIICSKVVHAFVFDR